MHTLDDCGTVFGNPVVKESSRLTGVYQKVLESGWYMENQMKNHIFIVMRT